jgi:hypothetical protein
MAKKIKSLEFPTKNADFDAAFETLMNHLANGDPESSSPGTASYLRLGIDNATVYTPLVNILGSVTTAGTWMYEYNLFKARATRTTAITKKKNDLKKAALKLIRPTRIWLKGKNIITPGFLTANDEKFFYIPAANPLTPLMEAMRTTYPVPSLIISTIKPMLHVVDAVNPESPKSKSLPEGVDKIEIARYVGTAAPTDPSQYTHLLFSGRWRNHSIFTVSTQQRQTAWYIARYIGTTGWEGAWSQNVSATIA